MRPLANRPPLAAGLIRGTRALIQQLLQLTKLAPSQASPSSKTLQFFTHRQQQTQWCWSACAVSVNRFYAPASTRQQCDVANAELGQTTCCRDGSTSQCNRSWYLDRALSRVGNYASIAAGKITFQAVKRQIDINRVVGMRIGWTGGGGHFTTVYGYHALAFDDEGASTVTVGDPWYGDSIQSYHAFPRNYHGGGAWTHSYFTAP